MMSEVNKLQTSNFNLLILNLFINFPFEKVCGCFDNKQKCAASCNCIVNFRITLINSRKNIIIYFHCAVGRLRKSAPSPLV